MRHQFVVSALLYVFASLAITPVSAEPIEHRGPPRDIGVVNREQIRYWLEQRGELSRSSTPLLQQQAVERFAHDTKVISGQAPGAFGKQWHTAVLHKRTHVSQKQYASRTVKVFAALIDFPDLRYNANRLGPNDTPMYYSNYAPEHYRQLLFSPTGFTGPSGQSLQSVNQYYRVASGQSFEYGGDVFGWVTASQNALYYGQNNGNSNSDKAAPQLVQEAVTQAVAKFNVDLTQYDIEDPADLDGDNNYNEPDGYIDHVAIFHSSIGEEAGGGVLGSNAIWSHRFFVSPEATITDKNGVSKKLFGYTIQPIDATAGVVAHEFGHDLGLPDEYDTAQSFTGEPIGYWSLMASGSWSGQLPGSKPSAFSPYAREFLQTVYGGKWVNQLNVLYDDLRTREAAITLHGSDEYDNINQIKMSLPVSKIAFPAPYEGNYQFYSGKKNRSISRMQFDVTVPNGTTPQMTMAASWDIEQDYDYAQVKINGVAIAGSSTIAQNPLPDYSTVKNYLSGTSNGWRVLNFDLSSYKNQTVTVAIEYHTDPAVLKLGLRIDDIIVRDESQTVFTHNAEIDGGVTLTQFARVTNQIDGEPQHYWWQLRSHVGNDAGLKEKGYMHGVVLWFGDENYEDNHVDAHPGHGYLSVVDADQRSITINGFEAAVQIRDAAFGLHQQTTFSGDEHLDAITEFDDHRDYSNPSLRQAGTLLPIHDIRMVVDQQADDSSSAVLRITSEPKPIVADFTYTVWNVSLELTNLSSGGSKALSYNWDFGDGTTSTETNPRHQYSQIGSYTVTLTTRDALGNSKTRSQVVSTAVPELTATIIANSVIDSSSNQTYQSLIATTQGGGWLKLFRWNFGDGTPEEVSSNTITNHTYASVGDFVVTLTVTDNWGSITTVNKTVTIKPLQADNLNCSVDARFVYCSVNVYEGTGSRQVQWSHGDGSGQEGQYNSMSHTYQSSNTFVISVTISDVSNNITLSQTITTYDTSLVPKFAFVNNAGTVTFQNQTVGGLEPLQYRWDFGDGTGSNEKDPVHVYAKGAYNTCLFVTDNNGKEVAICEIIINSNLVADFSYTADGLNVAFSDSSHGEPIDSWQWHFGDSNTSSEQNPHHTYPTPGNYEVLLWVSSNGYYTVKSISITVQEKPAPDSGGGGGGSLPVLILFALALATWQRARKQKI